VNFDIGNFFALFAALWGFRAALPLSRQYLLRNYAKIGASVMCGTFALEKAVFVLVG
jgi:hypothetical protein